MARLGDICTLVNGYAFKPTDWKNDGLPIIRIQNLNDVTAAFNYYDGVIDEKYTVNDGDLLFSWSGTPGTSFGAFFWKRGKGVLNQHIFNVHPVSGVDKEYLRYALNGNISRIIDKAHGGVGLQHITKKELVEIEIPLLPKDKQQQIVVTLDEVETLISLRKQQLVKLDELVKARFVELFDRAESSMISKLNDVCEEITAGGDRPKDTSEIKTEEYPYPVFANAATNEGLLCFSREYKVEKPCVTIAARGCTVGFTAIRSEKFTPVVRLITLVPNETVTPIYLKHYIDIKMKIEGNGAAQPQLTIPMIKSMEIMVPPIELQNEYAEFVKQTDKSKLAIQQSLDKLETLKKALMQKYFG